MSDAIAAALARIETRLGEMRTDFLAELGSTRTVLMARMDRLQSRVDQVQQEAFLAFAQGETVRRHSENTRVRSHDLADQISHLVRQVRMLRDRLDGIEGP